ncbi:MAG: adenosine kinase [Gammaproteobacteria bacterium]|nr:adenosine kinase [Gammaproteobacteria bacterium]NND38290.1 adenosine kinase [Pseudomonadales bacterium]MBT8151301.1 adenosine kinase [Gammaproteobacteria bacterium]NNL10874.1 adenosine kinase [Pseudomonadales bacterium]NNM11482.1 adenosine kinase [Pseudomonadales bacterium]
MKNYQLYGMGAALVDTEIQVSDNELEQLGVEKGLMTLVDPERRAYLLEQLEDHLVHSQRASGGSAGNTIIAASYFGAKSFFSGKVADDDNGHFYMRDMSSAGVDTPLTEFEPGITGKCLILITPDAERSMNTFLGASENFSARELDLQAMAASEYLYIESYLVTSASGKAAAVTAREHAQANGTRVALSFSDPGIIEHFRDGIAEIMGDKLDLVFCNRDEALQYAGTRDLDVAIDALKKVCDEFVITLSAEGALVFHDGEMHRIDGVKVNAVDTNGAGDMFAGAYLYGITNGMDRAAAGRFASAAAATVVSQFGPRLPAEQHAKLLRDFA